MVKLAFSAHTHRAQTQIVRHRDIEINMAIHIISGKQNVQTNIREANIQSVPFKIHADCDAEISKYFSTYIKDNDKILSSSFRGYPLKGTKLEIPDGYTGIVLHESVRPTTETENRNFYVINNFTSFTYWNWGKVPSKNDTIVQAMDWIDIAEALHKPVEEE